MYKKEQWRPIKDFQRLYKVSNHGNIFSLRTNKYRKLQKDKDGYLKVTLYNGNNSRKYMVHRLVATAFIPNPQNKSQIDHIDTIKTNNNVQNLRWATRLQNRHNPISMQRYSKLDHRTCLGKRGIKHCSSKPILCVQLQQTFWGCMQAERLLGVDHRHIQDVLHNRNRRKTAGGFHWEYKKPPYLLQ